MSLKKELESLKRQKREELRRLNVTYLQTKRDVTRKLSPDRMIRKHVGATIGVAAMLGMLLAPRPAARVKEVAVKKEGGVAGGFMAGLFKTAMTQLENLFPKKKEAADAEALLKKRMKKGRAGGLLELLLPLVLGKLDLNRIIAQITQMVMSMTGANKRHQGNGHAPDMSVADAGTVKPDDYENFQ